MTEDQYDRAYAAMHKFLDSVRVAFREMKCSLNAEEFDYIVYSAQDGLSLFSPWMNNDDDGNDANKGSK